MRFFKLHSKRIGIDLGTESILVVMKEKGIVINEPAIIAIEKGSSAIVAVGNEAKEMIGKTPEKIEALRPLKHGGIANLKATEMIVKDIIDRLDKTQNIGRPVVLINVHVGITEVEKRAILKLVSDTGAREANFVEEPIAAALGANLDVYSPEGSMVVDLGSGTTETAVISLGKIVSSDSIKIAGDDLDENIIDYVKRNFNIEIGKNAAEKVKIEIASAKPILGKKVEIKGRDLVTGFPKSVILDAFQVNEAIRDSLKKIVEMIKTTLERTPPELLADVNKKGIILTGGLANIDKIDEFISQNVGIRVIAAENPLECVALGIYKLIDMEREKYV
ncbi:MAG: rod shape-determining protein [Clostridia bacterium]|jgi:rod shape-determining protein MreB|nr:rod shape-determining protein [Clostridia bacterium]